MADGASDAQEELPTRGRGRLIELRKRRRSRSHSVRRAVRSRQLEPAEVDLTLYMSQRKILSLSEENKEKLRNIMRKFHEQKHFSDSSAAFAACDEVVAAFTEKKLFGRVARGLIYGQLFTDLPTPFRPPRSSWKALGTTTVSHNITT